MKLNIATCQFSVDRDIRRNYRSIVRQIQAAKKQGAHVVHFPELALSGYAGVEFDSYKDFDWKMQEECLRGVLDTARRQRMWVILGATHRLTGRRKPHNSLYIIDDRGRIIDRYDKLFCAGDRNGKTGDLVHYSPGSHFSIFTIRGVKCAALICHDFRYPELYREYKRKGAQLMFHSYHNGHATDDRAKQARHDVERRYRNLNHGDNVWGITVAATMQSQAANNYMWISCNNTSAKESFWPSFFVRPDGIITGRLKLNQAGVLLSTVDPQQKYYDASIAWRDRAMRGFHHSGTTVRDRRSQLRTIL